MLTYADVKSYLEFGLANLGYGTRNPDTNEAERTMPLLDPGPFAMPNLFQKTAGPMVVATVGNGAGLVLEQTYDQVFLTVRSLGPQNDYDSAERLAWDLDRLLLALNGTGYIGSTRVLYVTRAGGGPQLIDYDAGQRYHFQTTYVVPAFTGL